jgi:hypothetical protein
MKDVSVVTGLVQSAVRKFGAVMVELARHPLPLAVHIHNIALSVLLVAFVLADAVRLGRLIFTVLAAR